VKIGDSIKKPAAPGVAATETRAGRGAAKTEQAGGGQAASGNVHLSSKLEALTSTVAGGSVFDTGKVQQIRAAIASGQFQVDPEKIADGLMDTVKDLIHNRKA
jgi:negative regulator of flagellin synthesis FlgM